MQLKQLHSAGSARCSRLGVFLKVLLGSLGFAGGAIAQTEVTPPPTPATPSETVPPASSIPTFGQSLAYPEQSAMTPFQGTSQLAPGQLVSLEGASYPVPGFFQWGPVQLRPHLLYRLSYGDGFQSAPGQSQKTVINMLAPGMFFQIGNHWTLDYTPSLWYYSDSHFQDTVDHSVTLVGGTQYQDWILGLRQSFSTYSQPLVETGAQTDEESYVTGLNATYLMSTKTSLELSLNQSFLFLNQDEVAGQPLQDSKVWGTMDWLNYQFNPRFGAAIGVGGGFVDVSTGSDSAYEQLQGRVTWTVVDKLSFSLSGGLDAREFLNSPVPNAYNPIFALTARYQIFEETVLSINASRVVSPSYFQSQITESTGVFASLNQRLFKRLDLSLTGGYTLSTYNTTSADLIVTREDEGLSFQARLSAPLFKRASAAIFYYFRDSHSNQTGFTYTSSQVGLELAYRF